MKLNKPQGLKQKKPQFELKGETLKTVELTSLSKHPFDTR